MALFDFLRRAREREQERQQLASRQAPASRIQQTASRAPSPTDVRSIASNRNPLGFAQQQVRRSPLFNPQASPVLNRTIRETGRDVQAIGQGVLDVARATPRAATAIGLDLLSNQPQPLRPRGVGRILLGNEPVQPITAQVERTAQDIQPFLAPRNTSFGRAGTFGAAIPLAIGASLLDVTPFGAERRAVTNLGEDLLTQAARAGRREAPDLLAQARRTVPAQFAEEPADILRTIQTPRAEQGAIRRLPESIRGSEAFDDIARQVPEQRYTPISNRQTLEEGQSFIEQFPSLDEALTGLIGKSADEPLQRIEVAASKIIADKLQEAGRYDDFHTLVNTLSERATASGQAVQALSLFGRLTPTGALRFAEATINDAKKIAGKGIIGGAKNLELTDAARVQIVDQAKKVESILQTEGEQSANFLVESAALANLINDQVPVSIAERLRSYRNISLLLNPKTSERNILGGLSAVGAEALTRIPASILDRIVAAATGQRTIGRRAVSDVISGAREGVGQAITDVRRGVDTSRGAGGILEASGRRPTFGRYDMQKGKIVGRDAKTPIGRLINKGLAPAEKLLGYSLKVPDRAIFEAVYKSELASLARIAPAYIPEEVLIEEALYQAQRSTFQDKNAISQTLIGLRDALNKIPGLHIKSADGKRFGIGDAVFAFTQVPGSILQRGIEMTPIVGALPGAKQMYDIAKHVENPEVARWLLQRRGTETAGRQLVGTGIVGLGGILGGLGIIKTELSDDADVRNIEQIKGARQYTLNINALGRFLASGMDPEAAKAREGDKFVNYDLFQPAAMPLTIGADMAENGAKSFFAGVFYSALDSMNAIFEQPLFTGVKRIANAVTYDDNIPLALLESLASIPSSFIPTFASNMRLFIDPTLRQTFDDNLWQQTVAQVINRIPGLSQQLPPQVNVLGEERQISGDTTGQRLVNALFNPFITTQFRNDPSIQMIERIAEETGDNNFFPRRTSNSVTIPGSGSVRVSNEIQALMQQEYGVEIKKYLDGLVSNEQFQNKTAQEQAKDIESFESELYNDGAKYRAYVRHLGIEIPDDASFWAANEIVETLRGKSAEDKEYWDNLPEEQKAQFIRTRFEEGKYKRKAQ